MNFQFSIFNSEEIKKIGKYIIFSGLGLTIVSLIVSIWLPPVQSFRVVFGSVYVLFLPGLVLSFVFFNKKEIDFIERIALSFALSIAVVPLLVFYLNLLGMKINLVNSTLVIAFIIIGSLAAIAFERKKIKRKSKFGPVDN